MDYGKMEEAFLDRWGKGNVVAGTGGEWLFHCATTNYLGCPAQAELIRELWEASDDFDGFLAELEGFDGLRFRSQAWGEIARREGWDLPIADGAKVHEVYADAGDLKVGDWAGTCGFRIPNGYGDGPVTVIVCERGQVNEHWFGNLAAMVEGTIKIYGYDCAELSRARDGDIGIDGSYLVYARMGTVAFIRM